jgi:nucleotidyltransferase/DNA polymerase involved in DNA repair
MSALRLSVEFGKSPSHCPHTSHSVDDPDSAHCGIAELEVILRGIIDCVTRRMRSADRVGRTITLGLRFDDFASAIRSHSPPSPTAATATIESVALTLLTAARPMIDERR